MNKALFWINDPEVGYKSIKPKLAKIIANLMAYPFAMMILCIIAAVLLEIASPVAVYFFLGISISALVFGYIQRRQIRKEIIASSEIRQRTRDHLGATTIGSAIHVAGHPKLARDQPIVIALINDHLAFFSYEGGEPIDWLPLADIHTIQMVVYDADRIPHVEVIDNTAQALQIRFTRGGREWVCLFRRIREVRPIDWFHILEQARA